MAENAVFYRFIYCCGIVEDILTPTRLGGSFFGAVMKNVGPQCGGEENVSSI